MVGKIKILNRDMIKKQYIKIVLIILLFQLSLHSFSQKIINTESLAEGFYPGVVVTSYNDTLEGEIWFPKVEADIYKEVLFKRHGFEITYTAKELLSFRIKDNYYIGHLQFNENGHYIYVFAQQIVDGYVKYYRYLIRRFKHAGIAFYVKTYDHYYVSYGNLPLNRIHRFKELASLTYDNYRISNIFYMGQYNKAQIPLLINEYNQWLSKTGRVNSKHTRDIGMSTTNLNLVKANKDSLLQMQAYDRNILEYFFRIVYYAKNSPGFVGYRIEDKRNDLGQKKVIGLGIITTSGYYKVGDWLYYGNKQKLKKQEYYGFPGI